MKTKIKGGFTLIELLVVVAIIGILASIVLVSLGTARNKGAEAAVKSNLANTRGQAELFYASNGNSYATVCTNVTVGGVKSIYTLVLAAAKATGLLSFGVNTTGSTATATCNDSANAWAAEAPLKTAGQMWCVDSSGKSKQGGVSIGTNTFCN